MPGPLPRQHKYERHTIHEPIHSNKANMKGWLWRPNDIRGRCGPASWHLSCRWGKTPKKPHPGNLSRLGIELRPAAWQGRMLPPVPQRWTQYFSFALNCRYFCLHLSTTLCLLSPSFHFYLDFSFLHFPFVSHIFLVYLFIQPREAQTRHLLCIQDVREMCHYCNW